jgi:hypothetical protein
MTYNAASGQTTEDEARAALERARTAERRLGRELALEQAWAEHPTGRAS